MVSCDTVNRWVGEKLAGRKPLAYTFRCNQTFWRYLRSLQSFFFNIDENNVNFDTGFSQIDLCFLDAQMQPLCYTITHEGVLFVCE